MTLTGRPTVAIGFVVALLVAACSSPTAPTPTPPPAASPSPSASPSASAAPGPTTITSPEQAAAVVLALDPRFAGLVAQNPDLIGQCCFYIAEATQGGEYRVAIEIGWGDCPAGCTNRHHWVYTVGADATTQLVGEDGPPVPAGVGGSGGGTDGGVVGIRGIATAGPVCPVVRPNDPACADRPVVGAAVHVLDATGLEVATMETDASGAFVVTLPAGRYRVQADPFDGLMGTPAPIDVTVGSTLEVVQLVFDTGIR
jgi:hypothetical protein